MRIIYQVFCCWCPYWYHWHNTFFVLRMLLVILTYSDTIKILATLQTHSCCWQCSADVPYFGSCGNYLACSLGMEERYSSRAPHVLWPSHWLMVQCGASWLFAPSSVCLLQFCHFASTFCPLSTVETSKVDTAVIVYRLQLDADIASPIKTDFRR